MCARSWKEGGSDKKEEVELNQLWDLKSMAQIHLLLEKRSKKGKENNKDHIYVCDPDKGLQV